MAIGRKVHTTLPIETDAYKKQQAAFEREAKIQDRLDGGETITNPKEFPAGTPSDVIAVSRGKNLIIKEGKKMSVTKVAPAKAKNSETTADVKNPRKAAKSAPAKKAAKGAKPAKAKKDAGESRGRTSVYSGKVLVASPEALKANPRREGTAGFKFMEVVRKAGKKGIAYEELRAHKDFGNNHLAYDVDHGNVVAK